MPAILSLSAESSKLWAAGPEGLFSVQNTKLEEVIQPQSALTCCLACDGRLFAGGAPHGVAYSLDRGATWQGGWMDGVTSRVTALAADPRVMETGVLLAATDGEGILRSQNRGQSWSVCNFGLQSYAILTLVWAPPVTGWPSWEIVFAGTDEGCYRSPNGGRGWKRCDGIRGVVQALAVAADFGATGLVLAGTEDTGVWRSTDGGQTFEPVRAAPQSVNAMATGGGKWWASDAAGIWCSPDGVHWSLLEGPSPALVLLAQGDQLLAGNRTGIQWITQGAQAICSSSHPLFK
ncbi:MAG: hypothetical protein IPK16_10305 [Anaerolineales bacterium]|nr:hypothetical protein [Anaerolineales bacterium]